MFSHVPGLIHRNLIWFRVINFFHIGRRLSITGTASLDSVSMTLLFSLINDRSAELGGSVGWVGLDGDDAAGWQEFLFLSRNSSCLRALRLKSLGDFFLIFRISVRKSELPVSLLPGGWSTEKRKWEGDTSNLADPDFMAYRCLERARQLSRKNGGRVGIFILIIICFTGKSSATDLESLTCSLEN